MIADCDERAWWVFTLPRSTCFVPAETEAEARAKLVAGSYKGAPVHEWPCVGSRWTSRDALTRELLAKANRPNHGDSR